MPTNKPSAKKTVDISQVYRNEAFDIGFYDYFKDLKNNKISKVLNSRDRNVKLNTVTYRQLNSWEEHGLLTGEREGREWRRFSIMDALWLKIIQEVREFGLPLEKIKTAKESLSFMAEKCKVEMPFLEFYTAFAIGSKMPVLLLVFKDGVTVPANFTQYKVSSEFFGIDNHLHIDLNQILQAIFPNADMKPKYTTEMPVNVDEMELLAFLRVGDYEKVEIKYKNGKIDLLEGTERNVTEKVFDILNEKAYEEITIRKRDDGAITSIVRTKKKKVGK